MQEGTGTTQKSKKELLEADGSNGDWCLRKNEYKSKVGSSNADRSSRKNAPKNEGQMQKCR